MKELFISDLARYENQVVTSFFAVSARHDRSKRDGSPYFALTLSDRTGQMEGRMWETAEAGQFTTGDIVKVRGQVCRYKDFLQINIERIRKAEASEFDLGDYVPHTERNIDELWVELNAFVESFADQHLKALLRSFLDDPQIAAALCEAPAAKTMHHAWIGGLLEHIVSLLNISDLAAKHYGVHRDLLLTGVVLHDIGKLEELHWGTSFDYTIEGQLLGHITLGVSMIDRKVASLPGFPPALRALVQHLVLSHHGKYEFGSPKLPMTPEAVLLHYLDDMDAKMQTLQNEFARSVTAGRDPGEVTDWVRSLERPLLDTVPFLKASSDTAAHPTEQISRDLKTTETRGISGTEELFPEAMPTQLAADAEKEHGSGALAALKQWARRKIPESIRPEIRETSFVRADDLSFENGCLGKLKFETEAHAVAFLEHSHHEPGTRTNDGMHPYYCQHCGHWHTGH